MSERDDVAAVIRDYVEGWYAGDAARMDRSLHHNLAKRILAGDDAPDELREFSKERMMELTRAGGGEDPDGVSEIVVYHVSGDIASGHVLSREYLDFVHLARTPDGWKITNIMFRVRDQ